MKKICRIALFLDIRYRKSNGKYPLKIRVYHLLSKGSMLYQTAFEFTISEFQSIWRSSKRRSEYDEVYEELKRIETRAVEAAEETIPFSFELFEKKLYRNAADTENVFYHYEQIIARFKKENQFGTSDLYEFSKKSLKAFILKNTGREEERISFAAITPGWLKDYEDYMIDPPQKRSKTTVSMYLRSLRAVFNHAIAEKAIEPEIFPFSRSLMDRRAKIKYRIPAVRKVKKALNAEQLKILLNAKAATPEQEKARDFWFFSFICNGMNTKDIALLKYENMIDNRLVFYRAKTENTSENPIEIVVSLTDFARTIIEKYGNENKKSDHYIFPILTEDMDKFKKHRCIKNFTKFINQHIKKLAEANGVTSQISTYWARHSFATNVIRKGGSQEMVGQAFGHSKFQSTLDYFAGFEDDKTRKFMEGLMDL